jgi:hypothetical protein
MTILSHAEILTLHRAAVATDLAASRDALLAGISADYVASLRIMRAPSEQLLSDLHTLNAAGSLVDRSVPLVDWLANAVALTSSRAESSVFKELLRRARLEHSLNRPAAPPTASLVESTEASSRPRGNRTMLSGSAMKELQNALLSAFPTKAALARMLRFQLDLNLDEITEGTLAERVFTLVEWSEANGETSKLIEAARRENPGNPELERFQHQQVIPSEVQAPTPPAVAATHYPVQPVGTPPVVMPDHAPASTAPTVEQVIPSEVQAPTPPAVAATAHPVQPVGPPPVVMPDHAPASTTPTAEKTDKPSPPGKPAVGESEKAPKPVKLDWKNPGTVLAAAVEAVPVVRYALGVAGVAAVVAIVTRGFGLDSGTAVVGTLIVLALMVVLLVLAAVARDQGTLKVPSIILTWSFLLMVIAGCGLLFTSFFFRYPQSTRCLFNNECPQPTGTATGTGSGPVPTVTSSAPIAPGTVCTVEASGLLPLRRLTKPVDSPGLEAAAAICWENARVHCSAYAKDSFVDTSADIAKLACAAHLKATDVPEISRAITWDQVMECNMMPVFRPGSLHVRWGTGTDDHQARGMIGAMSNSLQTSGSVQGARWKDAILKVPGGQRFPLYFDRVDSPDICKWVSKCTDIHENCGPALIP